VFFGKVCGQPVHQMLGALCRDKLRIYNTCAGYRYVRSKNIRPVLNWNLGRSEGPFEDLDAFMNRADALAESLLESGIDAMKSGHSICSSGKQRPSAGPAVAAAQTLAHDERSAVPSRSAAQAHE